MVLADVDWQAVGAVATGIAALVTAAMAIYTGSMAKATRRIAENGEQQLLELRRQSTAAEATVDQGERTLGATTAPTLRVLRSEGEQAVVSDGDGTWAVMVHNNGPVPATISDAKLELRPPIFLTAVPGNAVEPKQQRLLRGDVPPDVLTPILERSAEVQLSLRYAGPNGQPVYTACKLKPKSGGERWLVSDPEKDEDHPPYGRAVFS